ncbi:hypothetical protein [Okeania sp. SIO2B9]|uniref:hypothetical protein n=1 Tax=Okeania sp. SIO2B9 TaxID=2607782 RepID=UPI00142A84A1|nr:hypothetical protein [Okeania sp. SIO2B9]NES92774.1 hypothetical protein [Okeania sp. SIO2B9]
MREESGVRSQKSGGKKEVRGGKGERYSRLGMQWNYLYNVGLTQNKAALLNQGMKIKTEESQIFVINIV